MTYRVIVTGSRKYDWRHRVEAALDKVLAEHPDLVPDMVVVHGGCFTGADEWADRWATFKGIPVEVYKADWDEGPSAGPKRNSQMVNTGANLLLGFWLPTHSRKENRGTRDCCTKADKIGIQCLCAWGDEEPTPWHSKRYADRVTKDPLPYPRKS